MNNNKNKYLRITILVGVIIPIFLVLFGYYAILPRIIDFGKYESQVISLLNKRLAYPNEIGKLDIKLTWNFRARVNIEKIKITKPDGSKLIKAETPFIEVSLFPLINNRVVFKKIGANNIEAALIRFNDGKFHLDDIWIKPEKPKYRVSFSKTDIHVNGYHLEFNENYIKPSQNYLFVGEKIEFKNLTPNKHIEMRIAGHSVVQNEQKTAFDVNFSSDLPFSAKRNFSIKGNIANIDLNSVIPYINMVSKKKFVSLAGPGDIKFDLNLYDKFFGNNNFFIDADFNGINVKTTDNTVISSHQDKINIFGRGFYNHKTFSFDQLNVNGPEINFKGSGKIQNYKAPKGKKFFDIRMNFDKSKSLALAKLYPNTSSKSSVYFQKVVKHNINALVNGFLAIKGNSSNPEMSGSINYEDLFFLKDKVNCVGKVDFMGPAINLDNKLFFAPKDFIGVTGQVTPFRNKNLNLNITSGDIDLNDAYKILYIVKDFFKLKLGPLDDMTLQGKGNVNLNIAGKFKNVNIKGYVEPKRAMVKHSDFYGTAKNITGKLKFNDNKVIYDDLTAYTMGMKIQPSGYTTLKGYSDVLIHAPKLEMDKALVFVKESPLLVDVKKALKDVQKVSGCTDAKIYLIGDKDKLDSHGNFVSKNASILYNGFIDEFTGIQGLFSYKNEDIFFNNLKGNVKGNNARVVGSIKKGVYADLKITSEKLDLTSAKEFMVSTPVLIEARPIINDYTTISGMSDVEVNLKGDLNQNTFQNAIFTNINGEFNHKYVGVPITVNSGVVETTPQKVIATNIKGFSKGFDFEANGTMSNIEAYNLKKENLIPDFNLIINNFNLSEGKEFTEMELLPEKIRSFLADFKEFHGNAKINAVIKPESFDVYIEPNNVSAVYAPYDAFVFIKKGKLNLSDKNLKLNSIDGVFSESEFTINGFINNYKEKPEFELTTNIHINYNDIDKIKFYSDLPVQAGGIIPFSIVLRGNVDKWDLLGRMVLEKGSYLNYLADIGLPRDKVRLITLDANGNKDNLNVNKLRVDVSDSVDEIEKASIKKGKDQSFKNLININGKIENLKSSKPRFKEFIIKTNNDNLISTELFNPSIGGLLNNGNRSFFSQGNFKANLKLNGHVISPEIYGNTSFEKLNISDYKTNVGAVNLSFNKNSVMVDIEDLNVGESNINKIQAVFDINFELPLLVNNLQIDSIILNIDEIMEIYSKGSEASQSDIPPFVITDGTLNANELIIRDLITTDVSTKLNLTPDWLLSLTQIDLQAAGGEAKGNLYYNFKSTDLSAAFNVREMQANAIATTLLTLPNEVYGTLNGIFRFSTSGKNQQELVANSNGYANFTATKGRFTRLGSLEYLLRAVNVVQSGLGGLNMNNIVDLVAPKKTGHFELLKGRVYVKDGVIYTDDITSAGKNLSLYFSGELDMLTNRANIQVLGKLSKKVSGMLGPIGNLSINEFIDYIPGLGFLPATPGGKGVIDLIPGLSKIPGLEINNNQKYRRFAVFIDGDLYDQNSVKNFRWIE